MNKRGLFLLTAALALSLTACGDGGDAQNTAQQSSAAAQSAQSGAQSSAQTQQEHLDEFAIEACQGETHTTSDGETFTQLSFQVRNLTDHAVDFVSIQWQALDANGDVADQGSVTVQDLAAGQAGWTGSANCTSDGALTSPTFASVRLYRYAVRERVDGTANQYTELYAYDFNEEITFDPSTITMIA